MRRRVWPNERSVSRSPATGSMTISRASLQQGGTLPTVTAQLIADLDDGSPAGTLDARIAKLVFLIGKLPKDGPNPTGLKATNDTIADLLIEDLRTDGERLRALVPDATDALAKRGILLEVEDKTYLLQTPAAAEWSAEYQAHSQDLKTDTRWLTDRRDQLIRDALAEVEKTLRPRQGQ